LKVAFKKGHGGTFHDVLKPLRKLGNDILLRYDGMNQMEEIWLQQSKKVVRWEKAENAGNEYRIRIQRITLSI